MRSGKRPPRILALLAAAAGVLAAGAVWAEPGKQPPAGAQNGDAAKKTPPAAGGGKLELNRPYGYHLKPILERINANPEQRDKIGHIVESYRSTIQPMRDQYKQKQQEFISAMVGGGSNETVMAKQLELGHLYSDIVSKYCLMRLEIRRLLSPQQILQFEAYGREHGWNH
jgi:Spy/CpxP family protein refolding chaperone